MADRQLPVRPDLDQLKHQAKDLLRAARRGEPAAVVDFERHHPGRIGAAGAKLADAQLVLARSYGIASWPRLSLACRVTDAIWRDDVDAVRELVERHPELIMEPARGTADRNWGPPMTYAANLGRDRIIEVLRERGAPDLVSAFDRAILQGQIGTARKLIAMGALPGGRVPEGVLMGPAETLNAAGMAFAFEIGARVSANRAEAAMVLETYTRNPDGKHRCLALLADHGVAMPDTAPVALHRGRLDLLEAHLRRDPGLLGRTFTHDEIFPPALGCHEPAHAVVGPPLHGATLLHMCVEYDEIEIARCLLERGMNPDVTAAVDAGGFGGHTPLFGCVVSVAHLNRRQADASLARLLLGHGADPSARASIRIGVGAGADRAVHEYRNVTPIGLGEQFADRGLVNPAAMRLLEARAWVRGGRPGRDV